MQKTVIALAVILLSACAAESPQHALPSPEADTALAQNLPAWDAVALLKTGEHPIWFELGANGPVLIDSPGAASIAPLTPWPHARHIVDIMLWEDHLVMAVNTDGFLVLGAQEVSTHALLYRVNAGGLWAPFTVGSLFDWQNQPAVLLYRNDFFVSLYPRPPLPQVFVLDKAYSAPSPASVPALRQFPPGESWEAETMHRGVSGYWYYRMREKGRPQNRTNYFRARDLSGQGERISQALWRESLSAVSRGNVTPAVTLPDLPEGFFYTGFARLGDILLATWEEQQAAAIAASGFMVVTYR